MADYRYSDESRELPNDPSQVARSRALVLINPHARQGGKNVSEAIAYLRSFGLDLIQPSIDQSQDFSQLICDYRDQVDLVIVGGGDGTLNSAVEGLIDTQLPLGILPLGTANDLTRTLGIPTSLFDACEAIATGTPHRIDLGWVNGKHFFNVASVGLSVKITQQLSREAKRRWGVLAYATTAFQVIVKNRPFRAEIRLPGQSFRIRTVQIAVGNGRYYGGGMTVAHDATIDDQRLDLYSLEIEHWWQFITLIPALWIGRFHEWLGVRTLEAQEIEIHTRSPHLVNTDGEITTQTPAHFRLVPHAIAVIVPRNKSDNW
ncbi:MAG: lipid kinase [Elainellaceae cyanobacterium]